MAGLTLNITHGSDRARMILREIQERKKITEKGVGNKYEKWTKAEETVVAYVHEREVDRVRRARREGGMPEYTTIQIPYTYAVLMAAHTYFTSVFMGRTPIFQFTGRHGETMQQVMAIEALHDYQALVGQLLPPLYSWLYDAGKYGLGVVGCYWEERYDHVSAIVEQPEIDPLTGMPAVDPITGQPSGKMQKIQETQRRLSYSGNKLYNIQPWDFLWDTRFPAMEFQRGEYCGVRRTLSWNEVKRRHAAGYYMDAVNEIRGRSAGIGDESAGSHVLDRPSSNDPSEWLESSIDGVGGKSGHPMEVRIIEMYIEIIPKEWGLSPSDFPEKWVFTCTSDYAVLMGATPHGAYHARYPYQILTLEAEAYGIVPRGMPETLEPIQQTIDWLVNSHFFNVRAALNNKMVVDPSRVVMKDVLDPLPGGIIRLKQEAFGTDTRLAVTQLQITDVTQNNLRDLQMMYGMGERTMGVNDQIMGMLSSGGRKTATEIRTSTSFGVNRLKTTAEYFSAVGFTPLSSMMVSNSQQYYSGEQKFKIAGDLVMSAGQNFLSINPDNIQGHYDFVPVDGALPIDRIAQVSLWRELLAQMQQMPEVQLQYDRARMFEWVAQLAGMKNITQFRVEADPMLIAQAKMGNVVPMGGQRPPKGRGGAPGSPGPVQPSAGAQIPGMGAML